MARVISWAFAIICFTFAIALNDSIGGDRKSERAELIGTWDMERIVRGMRGMSVEDPHLLPEPSTLTFHKDWYLFESPVHGRRYVKYRCNDSKKPREIDVWLVENEEEATKNTDRKPDVLGIYEIRGDELWRCWADASKGRPRAFDVLGHDGYTLTVHRRRKHVSK